MLFFECHELFGQEEFGKEADYRAVATMRRARKTGITPAFDTQSSRAEAISPKTVGTHEDQRVFRGNKWQANGGFRGDVFPGRYPGHRTAPWQGC